MIKVNMGLTEKDRHGIADGLSRLLASTFTLYLKTHYFHWNVTGMQFVSLHELFDKQYNELFLAVDVIAERIRALGFPAPGTYTAYQKLSLVQEAKNIPKAQGMIQELLNDHETITRNARELFELAEKAGDEATLDLITDRLDEHEKNAWMLRSLLE